MKLALVEAEKAFEIGDVPVGAILIGPDGQVLAAAYNTKEQSKLACDHAEIKAINNACQKLGNWRLTGCKLYVTLEPCPMCSGAIWASRISEVYFGAYDRKSGYVDTLHQLGDNPLLNHQFKNQGGILERECSRILQKFFLQLRIKNNERN